MATRKFMTSMKKHGFLTLLGILVFAIALKQFSKRKGTSIEGNSLGWKNPQYAHDETQGDGGAEVYDSPHKKQEQANMVAAAQPAGQNEKYASVNGAGSNTQGLPPSCTRQAVANPVELLPSGQNAWGQLNPQGEGDMQNVNLLKAGYHSGVNTVGNTLRNANLQVRSEPSNPQIKVSPWNNTTINPDLMRVPLELGCGPQ